jgi:hypothetical protein
MVKTATLVSFAELDTIFGVIWGAAYSHLLNMV